MLLNYTVSVTRVIIVTLALADGEMFVSHDYNYNHSALLRLSTVFCLIDLRVRTILVRCSAFSKPDRPGPARNRSDSK